MPRRSNPFSAAPVSIGQTSFATPEGSRSTARLKGTQWNAPTMKPCRRCQSNGERWNPWKCFDKGRLDIRSFARCSGGVEHLQNLGTSLVFGHERKSDVPEKLLTLSKKYLKEGGKIVTAWPPITSKNQSKWHGISDLWKSFDEALVKCDCGGQVITTASNMWKHGKLFIEAGAPEGGAQYFNSYVGTALPKYIYEAIRKRAVEVQLPQLQTYVDRSQTSRTMSSSGVRPLGAKTAYSMSTRKITLDRFRREGIRRSSTTSQSPSKTAADNTRSPASFFSLFSLCSYR
ncbi:hypothetical protein ANCDUO_22759 [Ancylostoma duodenale]|uniref:Uncharacterized protein n=1 Tax=Ancylostoma duodenale TaxID=51022 RepID=A0A0C2CBF3_9BILA|nr:hypothetical protein ANCDUO_22759 [Ancylostoma duodenale]